MLIFFSFQQQQTAEQKLPSPTPPPHDKETDEGMCTDGGEDKNKEAVMPPTMQQQIHNLRMAMLRREQSEVGMYDPDEVEAFCIENGAPTLFQAVIDMMTPVCDRRGAESYKKCDARRCAVVILHTLMYCQSQACNWLQRDTARFYYHHGLSDVGLRATHQMGHAVGMTNFYKDIHDHNKQHRAHITRIIEDAVKKNQLIVIIIDDYTNIHCQRRPNTEKPSNNSHMATVLIRIFEDLPAVPEYPEANYAGGIDSQLLLNGFKDHMAALTKSFLAGAPDQLHEIFFNSMNERLRLTTHMYGEHNDVRQIRTVRNAHLIDCTPQPLKSLANYRGAAAIYLATPVREYLKKHTVLIPGDWPSQFYQRQLAYNEQPDSPLRNTTPTMGPLHVSLNAQENVVCKFIFFFSGIIPSPLPQAAGRQT